MTSIRPRYVIEYCGPSFPVDLTVDGRNTSLFAGSERSGLQMHDENFVNQLFEGLDRINKSLNGLIIFLILLLFDR